MPDIASTTDPVATTLAIVALLIALGVLALLVLVLQLATGIFARRGFSIELRAGSKRGSNWRERRPPP